MSRGLGRLQRAVLAAIPDLGGAADVHALAEHVSGTKVLIGSSAYEATRQAVQGLVRRGVIRQCEGRRERHKILWDDGSRSWRDLFELI